MDATSLSISGGLIGLEAGEGRSWGDVDLEDFGATPSFGAFGAAVTVGWGAESLLPRLNKRLKRAEPPRACGGFLADGFVTGCGAAADDDAVDASGCGGREAGCAGDSGGLSGLVRGQKSKNDGILE